ncbi:MAG TPA: VOC family protein [Gammaproteobacteria bacterium]|nr:VOC family protein [Gammaproteobacteria bacterium]HET7587590.1 VOC family protein [Gammaproteobacteria bacterium]
MKNQVVWVDIPVTDLDRAIDFYSAVLGDRVDRMDAGGVTIGLLPHDENSSGGCLYVSEDYPPTANGPLIYLNVDGRMDEAVLAADRHGGKVVEPQHQIGEHGFRTIVIDPEGNRIALHAKTA